MGVSWDDPPSSEGVPPGIRHPRHPQVSLPRPSRRPPHHLAANPATSTRQSSEMLREAVSMDGFDHLGGIFVVSFSGWWFFTPHLKNICQNGNLPQIGVKIKHIWNHHLVFLGVEDRCYSGKKLAYKFPKHLICFFSGHFFLAWKILGNFLGWVFWGNNVYL